MQKKNKRQDACCEAQGRRFAKDFVFHRGSFDMYKDKVIDPAGYILIRINRERNEIELAHCSHEHVILSGIKGKTAEEVYATAIKMGIVTALEYAAYIGAELKKAEHALRYNTDYLQE